MKNTFIILIILLCGFSDTVKSQSADTTDVINQSISVTHKGKHTYYFSAGRQIDYKELSRCINRFPDSAREWRKHELLNKAMLYSAGAFDVGYLGAACTNKAARNNYNMWQLNGYFKALEFANIVPFFGSLFLSHRHFSKAIELYNKDIKLAA